MAFMVVILGRDDVVVAGHRRSIKAIVLEEDILIAAMAVDCLPRAGPNERDVLGGGAHDRSVLIVELLELVGPNSDEGVVREKKLGKCPQLWAGDLCERVEKGPVNTSDKEQRDQDSGCRQNHATNRSG